MVAFTGGIETGRRIAETCGRLYKRTLIETSGNDPFIVMPSAPIDIAARGAAFGAFLNCGQVCAAAERFYVHEQVYGEFMERLVHYTSQDPGRQRARPGRHGSARLAARADALSAHPRWRDPRAPSLAAAAARRI
jgi:acyl-CoA reductase-like NAD-dependent aldehyde dehydrogenase